MYVRILKDGEAVDEYTIPDNTMFARMNFLRWLIFKNYIQSGYTIEFK